MKHAHLAHLGFECVAYAAAFLLYRRRQKLLPPRAGESHAELADDQMLSIQCAALVGAALGATFVATIVDPIGTWMAMRHGAILVPGKSIVGALLGALAGVELVKGRVGISTSTGDGFVFPVMLGMMIGRLGCFFAGLEDNTYGTATTLPWGVDFGDGVLRHPTQLYEIVFLGALWLTLYGLLRTGRLARRGDLFKAFMIAYLGFRLLIDAIKPYPALLFGLNGIQWCCIAGLAYYAAVVVRGAPRESGSPA